MKPFNYIRKIAILLLIHCVFRVAHGQDSDLKFEHFTTHEGLSQSSISCILQDHMGFMWFGTQSGLNRFDGTQFVSYYYDPDDSASISGIISFVWRKMMIITYGSEL